MGASAEYVEYIIELLGEFPELSCKKYFGGVAFRSGHLGKNTQFATVLNDVLYFVVDDITRPKYIEMGLQPFSYEKQDKTVTVKKWYSAPEAVFDDEDLMQSYAMKALEAAMRK